MLVTRQCEAEQHPWSSKLEAAFQKPTSPRMSSYNGQLSTQPDWHGHYSFLPPGETNIFAQPFEPLPAPNSDNNDASTQRRPEGAQEDTPNSQPQQSQSRSSPYVTQNRSLDPLGLRQPKAESPVREPSDNRDTTYAIKSESAQDDSLTSRGTPALTHGSSLVEPASSVGPGQEIATSQSGNEESLIEKEDEDEVMEDDEIVEAEGEVPGQPQTAAERTAARRKMKRFRYE